MDKARQARIAKVWLRRAWEYVARTASPGRVHDTIDASSSKALGILRHAEDEVNGYERGPEVWLRRAYSYVRRTQAGGEHFDVASFEAEKLLVAAEIALEREEAR